MSSNQRKWTEADVKFLSQNYGRIPNADIAAAIGTTVCSVGSKAFRLGIKAPVKKASVPAAEIQRLKADGLTIVEIASRLNITRDQVGHGLYQSPRDGQVWTPQRRSVWSKSRVKKLIALAKAGKPTRMIAAELGTTMSAIRTKASKLGLVLPVGFKSYTQADIDLAYQMKAAGMTGKQIAEKLDDPPISEATVYRILSNESPSWEMV